MVPHTRRRFLQVATAVAGGLAGCGRLTGDAARSSRSVSETAGSTGSASDAESDPPTVRLRTDSETLPIRLGDRTPEEDESFRAERRFARIGTGVVDSRSRSQQLAVADDADGEAVSSFLSETEFDDQTVYVETVRIQECFRLRLCQVSWETDRIRTDYVRRLRPYDEDCAADAYVFESRLVRLPVALEEDSVSSFASSVGGRGRCDAAGRARAEGGGTSGSAAIRRASDGGER